MPDNTTPKLANSLEILSDELFFCSQALHKMSTAKLGINQTGSITIPGATDDELRAFKTVCDLLRLRGTLADAKRIKNRIFFRLENRQTRMDLSTLVAGE